MCENGIGYVGIDKDYFVSVKEVLNITAETGALETQDRVRDLPPADVIEVRHGHYIKKGLMWECSECGASTRIMKKYNVPNYCPCCGAKMDGEEQENDVL